MSSNTHSPALNKSVLIFILGCMTALGPFSIDMYLPAFSAMASDLHTDTGHITLSLSGYFIGLAGGQLLYGPLLDKFGRKKPLYIGLLVYILGSVGCMFVNTADALIVLRFIQAVGGCVAGVASVAMVRDLFPVEENAKVFALLMLTVGASPMVAPTIGGYVTASIGWPYIFLILAVLGLLVLAAVIFLLPNRHVPDKELSLMPASILRNFADVLKVPAFYTYTFTGAFAFAGLFAYVAGSPRLFMDVYGVNEKTYGWIFAGLSVGFIGANQVNNLLIKKFKSRQIIPAALAVQVLTGFLFLTCALYGWLSLSSTLLFIFVMLGCTGLVNPNAAALSIAPFAQQAGSASALMGAAQLGIGALSSVAVGIPKELSPVPLAMVMAGASVLAAGVLLAGRKKANAVVYTDEAREAVVMH